jgi:hypothetical protein
VGNSCHEGFTFYILHMIGMKSQTIAKDVILQFGNFSRYVFTYSLSKGVFQGIFLAAPRHPA